VSNGVIHVGAHKGEEVPQYLAKGRSPIILFEPQEIWDAPEGVLLIHCALSDRGGWRMLLDVPYHLQGEGLDTQSATGLPLIHERAIANGWTPSPKHEYIDVPVERFDEWVSPLGWERRFGCLRGSCSLLVIDVQGMELQVLKGFGDYLYDFHELQIECSSPALYEGGADAREVVSYLRDRGFAAASPILQHGDICFVRTIE